MNKRSVLVLDMEGGVSEQLRALCVENLEFLFSNSVAEARNLLRKHDCSVALVVFDSLAVQRRTELDELISGPAALEWIALTAPQALESKELQRFVLQGFYDYHTLPLDAPRLLAGIGHACGKSRLRRVLDASRERCGKYGIFGTSPAMKSLFLRLEKVIEADIPVLIGGETGTGKELVAQAIHRHSKRSAGPLVVVNCGAIPTHLIQSELFGHEKGAFTGAVQRQIGKIESANGGVLFLDEIGDLPPDMQSSLLRVLQDHTICRIGSTKIVPVDFRVVCATHVDLREAVTLGRFREDLFYRLNVAHLELPPLRKRGDDAVLLAEMVLRDYLSEYKNLRARGFSKAAQRAIVAYHWPGNVRELINRVQHALVMSENRLLSAADLGLDSITRIHPRLRLGDARASFDRDLVESSLHANGHNVSQAARQLGVSRVTFYRMMNKLKIPQGRPTETNK